MDKLFEVIMNRTKKMMFLTMTVKLSRKNPQKRICQFCQVPRVNVILLRKTLEVQINNFVKFYQKHNPSVKCQARYV